MFYAKVHSQLEVVVGPFYLIPPNNLKLTVFFPEVYDPALGSAYHSSECPLFPACDPDFLAVLTATCGLSASSLVIIL